MKTRMTATLADFMMRLLLAWMIETEDQQRLALIGLAWPFMRFQAPPSRVTKRGQRWAL